MNKFFWVMVGAFIGTSITQWYLPKHLEPVGYTVWINGECRGMFCGRCQSKSFEIFSDGTVVIPCESIAGQKGGR